MRKTKKIQISEKPTGQIRTKVEVFVGCPKCHTQLKVVEKINDRSKVNGKLLILK
jgi:hypothetical protein